MRNSNLFFNGNVFRAHEASVYVEKVELVFLELKEFVGFNLCIHIYNLSNLNS